MWVQNSCDPVFIPEFQVTKWWFHVEVPLGSFLLVVQVTCDF